jgi:serine protease DegQ
LLSINNKVVINSAAMLNLIAALKPNQAAELMIVRNRTQMNIDVLIGKRPRLTKPKR